MPTFSLKRAWGDLVARVTGRAQAGARPQTVVLDRTLPDDLRARVFTELLYDADPARVEAAAAELGQQGWACAAWELRLRAWKLRGQPPAQRPGPRPACAPAGQPGNPAWTGKVASEAAGICRSIDPSLGEDDCAAFYAALTDPQATSATLSAFATGIAAAHPAAARALQTRASFVAQQEALASQATAQAQAGVTSNAETVPDGTTLYTKPDVNVPVADAAIAQASQLSPRVPDGPGGEGAAYVENVVRARPLIPGGCVLVYRDVDRAWPAQVAKTGGGSKNQLGQLARLNPHLLAPDGTLQRFTPGTEVNVPCAWEQNLVTAGFKLRRD